MVAERAAALYRAEFGDAPLVVAVSPGRVNLIGEHVDYVGGICLPAAVDLRLAVAAGADLDSPGAAVWLAQGGAARLGLEPPSWAPHGAYPRVELEPQTVEIVSEGLGAHAAHLPPRRTGEWPDLTLGVLDQLQRGAPGLEGISALLPPELRLAIASDLPLGAGLSSSAATGAAVALAALALAGREPPALDVARLCRRAENEFLGVPSGLMDEVGCLLGVEGHALLFDAARERATLVSLPSELTFLVVASGIRRRLDGTAYRTRVRETRELLRRLDPGPPAGGPRVTEHVPWELSPEEVADLDLPAPLDRRARHIATEVARVRAAVECLGRRDVEGLGRLLLESHASLREDFEVSLPELDALVEQCVVAGCSGARLMGAGFGGSVLAVVDSTRAEAALAAIRARHRAGPAWLLHSTGGAAVVPD